MDFHPTDKHALWKLIIKMLFEKEYEYMTDQRKQIIEDFLKISDSLFGGKPIKLLYKGESIVASEHVPPSSYAPILIDDNHPIAPRLNKYFAFEREHKTNSQIIGIFLKRILNECISVGDFFALIPEHVITHLPTVTKKYRNEPISLSLDTINYFKDKNRPFYNLLNEVILSNLITE